MIQSFIDFYSLSAGSVGTTQVRTGYGFAPKLLIGLTQNRSSAGSGAGSALMSVGVALDDLSMRNVAWKVNDTTGTVTAARSTTADRFCAVYFGAAGSTTIDGEWEISAVGSDGQTTRVKDQYTDGGSVSVQVLALGGSAFANLATGIVTLQDPPGTSVVSSLSFAPDGVLFLATSGLGGGVSLGAAVQRGSVTAATSGSYCDTGVADPSSKSYTRYGECVSMVGGSGVDMQRGVVSAWRSDGFELTSLDNPVGSFNQSVGFVAFRMAPGFDCRILTGSTATSLTSVALTTSGASDFTPHSGILASRCGAQSSAGVSDNDGGLSIGVYTPTQESSLAWFTGHLDSGSTCTSLSNTAVYINMGSGDVVQGVMTDPTGSKNTLTCTMTDADPSAAAVWSLAFGSVPVRPRGSPLFF